MGDGLMYPVGGIPQDETQLVVGEPITSPVVDPPIIDIEVEPLPTQIVYTEVLVDINTGIHTVVNRLDLITTILLFGVAVFSAIFVCKVCWWILDTCSTR